MFGICIYAWLLPSPAKHNLYPFKETGLSMYVATCLLPEKPPQKKQIFGKDKCMGCVQDGCGCDVPGQEVERLMWTRGFSPVAAGKSPGWGGHISVSTVPSSLQPAAGATRCRNRACMVVHGDGEDRRDGLPLVTGRWGGGARLLSCPESGGRVKGSRRPPPLTDDSGALCADKHPGGRSLL